MKSQGQRDATKKLERPEKLLRERAERVRQFSTLLQTRKLEVRNSPFRSFDSPPGRF